MNSPLMQNSAWLHTQPPCSLSFSRGFALHDTGLDHIVKMNSIMQYQRVTVLSYAGAVKPRLS